MHALKHHLYIQLTWPIIILVCIFVILIERKVHTLKSFYPSPIIKYFAGERVNIKELSVLK